MNEAINHYGAIRLRVKGSGNLQMTLYSYDEVYSDPQANLAMSASNSIAPTVWSNFTQMTAKLRGSVTAINEHFEISQIIVYIKPVGLSFPQ